MCPYSNHQPESKAQTNEEESLRIEDIVGARLRGYLGSCKREPKKHDRADELGEPGIRVRQFDLASHSRIVHTRQ